MGSYNEVLEYWFGDSASGKPVDESRISFWFKGDETRDKEIREKFEAMVLRAKDGELDDWKTEPKGWLALIILLDQFSRNIFRGTADAFAQDRNALKLCLRGLERGIDRQLSVVERVFFYLPMEHSEDPQVQKKSMQYFTRLAQDASSEHWDFIDEALNHAIKHNEVIERFGRFPHRNAELGRESTKDEMDFLQEPDSEL